MKTSTALQVFCGKIHQSSVVPPQKANDVERWCFLCCRIENGCLCDAFSWHAISCCHGDAAILLTAKYGFIALWWILAVHSVWYLWYVNSLRPRQNGRRFADDTFKCIFLNENVRISIKISLKFAPEGPINNIPSLVQIMAWRRPGDKPLSEPMMVSLLAHICVTRPQWVKGGRVRSRYLGNGTIITFCSIIWNVITYSCATYLLLTLKSTL